MSLAEPKWDARTRGGRLGHQLYLLVIRVFGPRYAELLLYPVVTFYLFWAGPQRAASMMYLDRVLGPTTWLRRWTRSFRHLLAFARAYLDGAMLASRGRQLFSIEHHGSEHLRRAHADGRGAVLLTAHLGTWELSTGMLKDEHGVSRVALVMFKSDAAALQGLIESVHGKRPRVIAVGGGELAVLEILRAVRGGELVAMQGDRSVDARDVRVPFFGHDARWPIGPWVVAALSGAPVLCSFAVRTGPRQYRFVADPPRPLRFEPGRARDEQLKEWIAAYVARVEALLREHPYQWFNFFDFWATEAKLPGSRPPS